MPPPASTSKYYFWALNALLGVAFIVENGAPIELLEFTDPNHPGRRKESSWQ